MKVSLCEKCGSCPEVALVDEQVEIGEDGNLVQLEKGEWNSLVDKVKAGELKKV